MIVVLSTILSTEMLQFGCFFWVQPAVDTKMIMQSGGASSLVLAL